VNAVAPINAHTPAATRRMTARSTHPRRTCSATRNHIPAATALDSAARTLIRAATLPATGKIENTRPTITNNGLPGGCGRPNVYAAAMYSLVSHMAVDGAIVSTYNTSTNPATPAATP
jgi:hypothetical protein